jgi:hypothetical protein
MKKRVKRLWLKALRSGKYKQAQGMLKTTSGQDSRYCCLGVLCEVAVAQGVIQTYCATNGLLPDAVEEWAGLQTPDPRLGPRVDSRNASWLNDQGKSFTFIADRIEKYL